MILESHAFSFENRLVQISDKPINIQMDPFVLNRLVENFIVGIPNLPKKQKSTKMASSKKKKANKPGDLKVLLPHLKCVVLSKPNGPAIILQVVEGLASMASGFVDATLVGFEVLLSSSYSSH